MVASFVNEFKRGWKRKGRALHVERAPPATRDVGVWAVSYERGGYQVLGTSPAQVDQREVDVGLAEVDQRVAAEDQVSCG